MDLDAEKGIEKCTKMIKCPHLLYMLGGDQGNSYYFLFDQTFPN